MITSKEYTSLCDKLLGLIRCIAACEERVPREVIEYLEDNLVSEPLERVLGDLTLGGDLNKGWVTGWLSRIESHDREIGHTIQLLWPKMNDDEKSRASHLIRSTGSESCIDYGISPLSADYFIDGEKAEGGVYWFDLKREEVLCYRDGLVGFEVFRAVCSNEGTTLECVAKISGAPCHIV